MSLRFSVLMSVFFSFFLVTQSASTAHAYSGERAPLVQTKDNGGSKGDKVWFAYWFPEKLKAQLEDKKWLLAIVSLWFFAVGAGIWGPIVFNGAQFDMEWALPVLIYLAGFWGWLAAAVVLGTLTVWFGVGFLFYAAFPIAFVFSYFGVMTMFANLNRPGIELKK